MPKNEKAPKSMTGFARQEEQYPWGVISCEIRSVNHRYLEPQIRLPELLRPIEPAIREALRERLHRGKIEVNFQLELADSSDQGVSVNKEKLEALINTVDAIRSNHSDIAQIDPIRLLQWPGVVEQMTPDTEDIHNAGISLVGKALTSLVNHRQREGLILKSHIEDRLEDISQLVVEVRAIVPQALQLQKDKLISRLEDLKSDMDEIRLEQEMVLLANKSDVAEELDRLDTHIREVKHILAQPKAIGRRLDFMMQELNREANTLSSKAITTDTSQAAVSIKVLIEQMREQIQNIE
jgi:uncharacterized protein (TIGR00255 family)